MRVLLLAILWPTVLLASPLLELEKQLTKSPYLTADFTQTRKIAVLSRPLVSSGTFAFRKDHGATWETTAPIRSTVTISENGISQKTGSEDDALTIQSSSNPTLKMFTKTLVSILGGRLSHLKEQFAIDYQEQNVGWSLTLQPTDQQLQEVVSQIVLIGDRYVSKVEIAESSGDSTSIEFVNVKANG